MRQRARPLSLLSSGEHPLRCGTQPRAYDNFCAAHIRTLTPDPYLTCAWSPGPSSDLMTEYGRLMLRGSSDLNTPCEKEGVIAAAENGESRQEELPGMGNLRTPCTPSGFSPSALHAAR